MALYAIMMLFIIILATSSSRPCHRLHHHTYLSIDSANFICASATSCKVNGRQNSQSRSETMRVHTHLCADMYTHMHECGVLGAVPAHQQKARGIDTKACTSNHTSNSFKSSVRIVTINTYRTWSTDLQASGGGGM
jgi:hypothetical protein